ncbi:DUF1800 domain-containing protein [Euzebya sp.]|uniref:DUF1800 domain-containing protein n=1 Tax=Euzebya sp. TaxID=1971409 RepID=UPI003511211A
MDHYVRGGRGDAVPRLFAEKFSFGATPQLVDDITAAGPYAWLDRQLDWGSIPEDPQLTGTLGSFRTLGLVGPQRANPDMVPKMAREQRLATLLRAVHSPRHLHEVLVEFWNDHFNVTFESGITNKTILMADRDVARAHATGRFADLLLASARSVAMLAYLDNDRSRAPHPNENYARELMELHTLGVDGGYTEADVVQAARALTGWSRSKLDAEDTHFGFVYKDRDHYTAGPIQVMDLVMPAMSGPDSIRHGETLLAFLAAHPATATHLCTKLARRFVADQPPRDLVDAMVDTWFTSDGHIAAVIRTMARHAAFLASRGRKVDRPFGALARMLRILGDTLTLPLAGGADAPAAPKVDNLMNRLGQPPFGWAAPNGYPDVAAHWATSGGLLVRWNTALDLVSDRIEGVTFDAAAFRARITAPTGSAPAGSAATVGELIAALSLHVIGRSPTTAEGDAYAAVTALPATAPAGELDDVAFRALVAAALSTPAGQRR